ncbi:MAG: hypothetical protein SGBAC_005190 [Bacillariaceae sp.]
MNRYFYGSEKLHLLKTLHSASRDDDTETIERLLDQATNDIDIDGTIASQRNEPTALQIACMWGNLSTVRLLLDRGANIEARDKCLQAPLHHASMKNSLEVAQLLLDRGANVEAKDHNLQTPLHFISSRNNVEFAQLLLDRGANIEAKDEELQTPLYHAMNAEYQRGRTQRMDVAVLLLARGADSNANGKHGWRLLHAVCASNNCLAAQMLIDHDATGINAKDDTELTPLHLTCIHGRYQAARLLLNRGATVNSREKNQLTPLHLACSHGHVELARLLLDRQADIEAKTISRGNQLVAGSRCKLRLEDIMQGRADTVVHGMSGQAAGHCMDVIAA